MSLDITSLITLWFFIILIVNLVIYFFWPETARLTLEEIAQNFGEEVAVHLTDATDEEKARIDQQLVHSGGVIPFPQSESSGSAKDIEKETIAADQNVSKA